MTANKQEGKQIRVLDEFATLQGTGHLVGTRQYFVRLAGCSVTDCRIRSVCDEAGALNPRAGECVDPRRIVRDARREVGANGWLHVTGGEPLDQQGALAELLHEARRCGLRTHLQTSGARTTELEFDWTTVSPKSDDYRLTSGSELVLVDTGFELEDLRVIARDTWFLHYFLQPLWGDEAAVTAAKVCTAAKCGLPWRLTDQMHKRWAIR
jgi:7-carboxy-7-deazaguanine synthase